MNSSNHIIILSIIAALVGCSPGNAPSEEGMRLADEEGLGELANADFEAADWLRDANAVEQWLRILSFRNAMAMPEMTLCSTLNTAPVAPCADAGVQGMVVIDWMGPERYYRLSGSFDGGAPFAIQGRTAETDSILIERAIRVLTDESLASLYEGRPLDDNDHGHTVVVRAVADGEIASGVTFELESLEYPFQQAPRVVYANEDGSFKNLWTRKTTEHGHAVFMNVRHGHYVLSASRDGVECGSTEVWADGFHKQLIAPEIICD